MRTTDAAETRRLFIALAAATVLHGALFVAIDRAAILTDAHESRGRDALRVEVAFAHPPPPPRRTREVSETVDEAPDTAPSPGSAPSTEEPMFPAPAARATSQAEEARHPRSIEAPGDSSSLPTNPATHTPRAPDSARDSLTMPIEADEERTDSPPDDGAEGGSGAIASHGSPVSFLDTAATIEPVRYVEPRYPEGARRAGIEGAVALRLSVDRRGRVVSAHIIESSGAPELDVEAVRAARLWRFPRGEDDRESTHRIRFSLEEQ